MVVVLTANELRVLDRQDPASIGRGGFQRLLVKLQYKVDRKTNALLLGSRELEQIPRYAFDYDNGGWENRLIRIFSRTLEPVMDLR